MTTRITTTVAIGLLLGGLTVAPASGATSGPGFDPEPITWGPCRSERLQKAGAECGTLDVPLDYANPGGTKISLAVSRIRHTSPPDRYQGVMLVNPGGPGGSGLGLSVLGQYVPHGVGGMYDWIGFDPRGVGASEPSLSCDPDFFTYDRPAYVPRTGMIEKTRLKRAREYTRACAKNNGPLLGHMKTTDNVKDMESLRKALGAERINYYGFSYGTYLGQVYATTYPDRVRRLVMDGVVDPQDVWYRANLNQDIAFDRTIGIYFDWIARYDSVYHLGDTGDEVESLYYEQLAELDRTPAGGLVGPAEWTDVFLGAGYGQYSWKAIAEAFAAWVHRGDWQPLRKLYDRAHGQGDNGYAVYAATECTDAPWPKKWKTWRADNWRVHAKAPFETWANAWYNAPCLTWPAKAGERVRVDGGEIGGALLINQEFDAATPYSGALEVRERFPNAALIGLPGGTVHSGSLSGNACVDDRIAAYLATGKLPERKPGRRADVTCEPLPEPVPEGAKAPSALTALTAQQKTGQPEVLREALKANRH